MMQLASVRVVSIASGGEGRSYDITDEIEGLSWSSVDPGGDERCTFTLKRSWFSDNPEIARGNLLRVMCGVDVLWQGRVEETDRSAESAEAIAVTAYGLGARLKDGTFREIFIDRDLAWGEPSTQRKINMLSGLGRTYSGAVSAGAQDGGSATPGLTFLWMALVGGPDFAETWYYGGGIDIHKLRYDFDIVQNIGADWSHRAYMNSDDLGSVFNGGPNHTSSDATDQMATSSEKGRKYIHIEGVYSGGFESQNINAMAQWRNIAVLGWHELSEQGSWPDIGFTVDQMVQVILDDVDGVLIRHLDAQSYVVQQAAFKDPVTHEDGIAELNKLEGCNWGTWGPDSPLDTSVDGQFDFKDREPNVQHWFVRREDCDDINLHSETATLYGAVDVTYEDIAGIRRTIRRTVDVPDLDGAGLSRVYPLDIGKSKQEVAEQMGDAFLAIWGQFAPARGSFATSLPVRHYQRGELSPVYLRADGSNVRIGNILPSTDALALDSSPDRRTTFPVKRIEVNCSGEVPVAQVEIDQTNDTLSILQARQGLESALIG